MMRRGGGGLCCRIRMGNVSSMMRMFWGMRTSGVSKLVCMNYYIIVWGDSRQNLPTVAKSTVNIDQCHILNSTICTRSNMLAVLL